jgi:pyruvate,water dikinase
MVSSAGEEYLMIVWLGQPAAVAAVGAKSAHLSRLAHHYPVPHGFALPVTAFTQWIADSTPAHLSSAWQAAVAVAYQQLAVQTETADPPVAVRSSAVDEDGQHASFAGQYESYLNVRGSAAVEAAIIACWQSAFGERVQHYRQQGIAAPTVQPLAVLVQQMVPADLALVAFSRHPVTQQPEVVINATWGLGQSIVDGSTTPDTYVVRHSDRAVVAQTIGDKASMTILQTAGVKQIATPRPMRSQAVLNATQIQEVTHLTLQLEAEMGWPVDIEAAYRHHQLHLLQCRPITTAR